jgi:predicted aconitase
VLRLAQDIPVALRDADQLFPLLGLVLGRRAGSAVAVIDGLAPGQSEDRLKALGAAAASSGSVAMFHVTGSTPEAPTLDDALQRQAPDAAELITLADLRGARDELTTDAGEQLAAVSLGTPHASLAELERYAAMLGERRVHDGVQLLISTGRETLAEAARNGISERLRDAGAELLVDTCSYIAPILRSGDGATMTDSAKWAYYAPGNVGARVVFGSTAECIRSAVAGRVTRDDTLWGGAP